MYTHTHISPHTHTHVCNSLCMWVYIYMWVYMCMQLCTHMNTHVSMCTCSYTYTYVDVCLCVPGSAPTLLLKRCTAGKPESPRPYPCSPLERGKLRQGPRPDTAAGGWAELLFCRWRLGRGTVGLEQPCQWHVHVVTSCIRSLFMRPCLPVHTCLHVRVCVGSRRCMFLSVVCTHVHVCLCMSVPVCCYRDPGTNLRPPHAQRVKTQICACVLTHCWWLPCTSGARPQQSTCPTGVGPGYRHCSSINGRTAAAVGTATAMRTVSAMTWRAMSGPPHSGSRCSRTAWSSGTAVCVDLLYLCT